ncbi:MAG: hypothetical protein WBG18_01295 [Xanthobacteraceae bacterium]
MSELDPLGGGLLLIFVLLFHNTLPYDAIRAFAPVSLQGGALTRDPI